MNAASRLLVILVMLMSAPVLSATDIATSDSLPEPEKPSSTRWIKQLIDNGFHINDPGIDYPRFPRFLKNVYNWGDRTFNSYDTAYVVSTGKNWKVFAKNYDWGQAYSFLFPGNKVMRITSDLYADIGAYISFMAVSVGYMFNANELIGGSPANRSHFNFNFTCSLFNLDYNHYSTLGGARVTRLSDYNFHGKHPDLNDLSNTTTTFTLNYFFNHNRYSHAAAYCYSKYQLRSAGSWLAGIAYQKQDISMDFNSLPSDMTSSIEALERAYRFNYTDWMLQGGYCYNVVMRPRRWLINTTFTLGAGYKRTFQNNANEHENMFASSADLLMASVYNHRALFIGLQAHVRASMMFNNNYTFVNTLLTFQATIGARF